MLPLAEEFRRDITRTEIGKISFHVGLFAEARWCDDRASQAVVTARSKHARPRARFPPIKPL
jgi:hypothetical protein